MVCADVSSIRTKGDCCKGAKEEVRVFLFMIEKSLRTQQELKWVLHQLLLTELMGSSIIGQHPLGRLDDGKVKTSLEPFMHPQPDQKESLKACMRDRSLGQTQKEGLIGYRSRCKGRGVLQSRAGDGTDLCKLAL